MSRGGRRMTVAQGVRGPWTAALPQEADWHDGPGGSEVGQEQVGRAVRVLGTNVLHDGPNGEFRGPAVFPHDARRVGKRPVPERRLGGVATMTGNGPRVVAIGAAAQIFGSHMRGLAAVDARVVGVQDVNQERLRPVSERLGCPAFEDVEALLQTEADLAVITAPHPFHAELSIACLRAGLDVLVEKPIAVEVAEADRMVAEAERLGRTLAVCFQHRLRPEVQAARRLVQEGAVGEVQRLDLLATWPRRAGYFTSAHWRGSWRGEGGGVLINQGQHDLDVLCYVAGQPSRIVSWHRTQLHAIETEDTVSAMLEWPSGATGFLHISTAESDEEQRL